MSENDILKDLVKFNTIKDKENKEILDYIEKYLRNLGFEIEARKKYLIMTIGEKQKLAFIGHSDTVDFIEGWKTNPFNLEKKNDKLYGLGACDMKGGIAAFLQALKEIDLSSLKNGIKICITYDEEIGFTGIEEVIKDKIEIPEYAIVGEPTYNQIQTGCKGLFAVKIKTNGIKMHSSRTDKGKSANSAMIKFLYELENFYNENIKNEEDFKFEVPYTTMNIGLIKGGSGINSISDMCDSYVDFRVIEEKHVEMLKEKLTELSIKYDASIEIDFDIKPFFNKINFIEEENTASFMTEASFINSNRIILGPGPVTAHEINEYVEISSMRKTVEQYKYLINKICY